MSVIRIKSADRDKLIDLADKILLAWRGYTDEEAFIFAETDGEPHNTITPIARRRDGDYELDLVLRNNITTEEHPLGVYHPHAHLHHIKKENIGLIEVMGLAVLPARLKGEMAELRDAILTGKDLHSTETLHHMLTGLLSLCLSMIRLMSLILMVSSMRRLDLYLKKCLSVQECTSALMRDVQRSKNL